MKLIDKEKLLEDLKQKRYSKRSLELIESQPEVKAIPIEWIKKYLDIHTFGCGDFYYMTYEMLADWEKENEKSV